MLAKVQAQYVDLDKVGADRLFHQGLNEFLAALTDPNFTDRYLKGVDESVIVRFRANLQKAWSAREVPTPLQAKEIVAAIGIESKRRWA